MRALPRVGRTLAGVAYRWLAAERRRRREKRVTQSHTVPGSSRAGSRVSLPRGQVPAERVLWQDVAGERQTETCASRYSRLVLMDGGLPLGYRRE